MAHRTRAWLAVGCGLICAVSASWAAGRNPPRTTAELLVDLARDYGLAQRGRQTAADVQHVQALLRAAIRLDPKEADAYTLLYELAQLGGDDAEAGRMLTGLLDADPTNQTAFALWLAAGLRAQQTVEQQTEWLHAVAESSRPPALLAQVHVELARLALECVDARQARHEIERALELEPASPDAAALAVQTLDSGASPAERLRTALRVLTTHPLSPQAAWQVALVLDEYGFADEADRFYEHVTALHAQSTPHVALPGRLLLDLAHNRMARGRLDEAILDARQAIASDASVAAEAGILLSQLLARKGNRTEANQVSEQLAKRFAPLSDPWEWPVNEVAQAAWFYCTIAPDPHRAAMLAKAAAERSPTDAFVQRVLGWAQAANLQIEDARRTLEPLAGHDPYAAYMLAKLTREAGDAAAAQRIIASLNPRPTTGPAFDLLSSLDRSEAASQPESQPASQPTSLPAPQRDAELSQVLAGFDARVLKFRDDPGQFLELRVTMDDLSPAPGEPWWATFALANRGPFPITLGPDAAINPVLLLSFTVQGDRTRSYAALTTVSVDRVRVLYPGQTVRVRRTVDVGPVGWTSRLTPQQAQRVELQVLLDAELGPDEKWRPAPGGQQMRPAVYFNRLPASTGVEGLAALFAAIAGEDDAARVRAIEVVAELLGERQRAELKRLNYEPGRVPADKLRTALVDLLGSDSWELRVRTLEALQVVGLDRGMTDAVEQCLAHSHWLVRMMAVRLLARQGRPFAERAQSIADHDADELVRALAGSYLAKWATPTTAPSEKSPE